MTGALRATLALAVIACAFLLFRHLSYPLLWNDEAYTVVYAERVLEYGYPKVHGTRNVVYALDAPLEAGVKETNDAYIGSPWGQYYVATLGVLAARSSDDLYTKTALLRLPFALLGAVGVALFAFAGIPLVAGGERARLVAAIGFVLLSSASVSLILHLREARYYALVVFLGGAITLLFRRREVSGSLGRGAHGVLQSAALLALFACYYPAFVAFGASLAIFACVSAARAERSARLRELGLRLAPLLAAAGLALPLALYWEVPSVVAALREGWDTSFSGYLRNLAVVGFNLSRFELLVPVLVAKLGLAVCARRGGTPASIDEDMRHPAALSNFLTGLLLLYVLVVSRTPFIFERYFVVLSPLLAAVLVLDTSRLVGRLRDARAAAPALTLLGIALAASFVLRAPELRGRIHELRVPVQGPLDATIPYLASLDRPEDLVIATNYEDPAFMYYLRSRVIVGFNGAALERDLAIVPDVVAPRIWPQHRDVLTAMLRDAEFTRRSFPIFNSPTNNIPSLSPYTLGSLTHRFATRRPEKPGQAVMLFERKRPVKP